MFRGPQDLPQTQNRVFWVPLYTQKLKKNNLMIFHLYKTILLFQFRYMEGVLWLFFWKIIFIVKIWNNQELYMYNILELVLINESFVCTNIYFVELKLS